MKKILTILFTSLIVFLMFVGPGNVAFAHEGEEDCLCNSFTVLDGAEKNKIVAEFLASDEFKTLKSNNLDSGYKWNGISKAEVTKFIKDIHSNPKDPDSPVVINAGTIGVAVPFFTSDGKLEVFFFLNGIPSGSQVIE
ncbi:hypothetical protein P9D43_23400 [Neobacillus niacini]|uniref:hypothetical protein n=1 Tax=Neobacillus niacini TaxID=86668 RepID=UPI0007ABF99B|nr:hypothetical protein [Neobacillus niacini]MEC1524955.1 hypothetical protein [Neobacillus niacini]